MATAPFLLKEIHGYVAPAPTDCVRVVFHVQVNPAAIDSTAAITCHGKTITRDIHPRSIWNHIRIHSYDSMIRHNACRSQTGSTALGKRSEERSCRERV